MIIDTAVLSDYLTVGAIISISALYYRIHRNRSEDLKAAKAKQREINRRIMERLLSLEKGSEFSSTKEDMESFRLELKETNVAISKLAQSLARMEGAFLESKKRNLNTNENIFKEQS